MAVRIELPIEGMTCDRCAARVGEALRNVPGVKHADVSFADRRAAVELEKTNGESVADRGALAAAVAAAGYRVADAVPSQVVGVTLPMATPEGPSPAQLVELQKPRKAERSPINRMLLAIDGMHCASCVGRVEKSLSSVPGVETAHVNLALGEATVRYDVRRAQIADLVNAVASAGYGASPIDEGQSPAEREARQMREAQAWRRRLAVGLVLLIPLVVLHFSEDAHSLPARLTTLIAAAVAQVVLGTPFLIGAIKRARHLSTDMDTLIALGTTTAFVGGLVDWFAHRHSMYFMDAALILAFVTLGKYLEAKARHRTGAAVRQLLSLAPTDATVVIDGRPQRVDVTEVDIGATLLVRPGERVPLDAVVISGHSALDQAWLTGESLPIEKQGGDEIFAGTINGSGSLTARVIRRAGKTTLAQTIDMVRRAQETKPRVQRLADRVVGVFVPIVLSVAFVTLAAWGFGAHNWAAGLSAFIAVLVVACPCALGLATPTAVVTASGRGAESGILYKEAAAIETAARITAVVFDKTGTLTEGKPRVTRMVPLDGVAPTEVLSIAAAAQRHSSHPLSQCVVAASEEAKLSPPPVERAETIPARGIVAPGPQGMILVGNERHMQDHGLDTAPIAERLKETRAAGETPLLVAVGDRLLGFVVVADAVSPQSRAAVAQLHRLGLKTMLLSGDHHTTVAAAAREVGIDECAAEVLPSDKQNKVRELQQRGERVAMVGDGLNDAPALSAADLGIAVGHGADAALEAADIVLASRDLRLTARALTLARLTMTVIRQNLAWALGYNMVLIPAAAGVLAPWLGADWRLPPVAAAAAMAASSVSVVLNSLSLRVRRISLES